MMKFKRKQNKKYTGEQRNTTKVIKEHPEIVYVTEADDWIKARTENQKKYIQALRDNDLIISIGPAGTGKTFLCVAAALQALKEEKISKIVITRPVVEAGEHLGYLPGTLEEKINPYLRPIYDAFYSLLGEAETSTLMQNGTIEIAPLAYMRGRTLEDAFIILDEAQNTSVEQMHMLLTRMGMGSKVIVTGDVTQIDLPKTHKSGLVMLKEILVDIKGVYFQQFTEEDVVRHPLVREIVRAYETWRTKKENESRSR